MRPAGRVQIGEQVVDAVAEFGFIDDAQPVRVVSVDGMRVAVEQVSPTHA
jgi:membrane-bound ClpP family serine protease